MTIKKEQIKLQGMVEQLITGYQLILNDLYGQNQYQLTCSPESMFEKSTIVGIIAQIGSTETDRKLLIFNRNVQTFSDHQSFILAVTILIQKGYMKRSNFMLPVEQWESIISQVYDAFLSASQFNRDEMASYWKQTYLDLRAYLIDSGLELSKAKL